MHTVVQGIGTALPPRSAEQSTVLDYVKAYSCTSPEQERLLSVLYRRSGVKRRSMITIDEGPPRHPACFPLPSGPDDMGPTTAARMALFERETPALADAAARSALISAGARADEISQLVTVSCTGFAAPGFDIALFKTLGLNPSTGRTNIGFMGCHGALNGLRVADGMIRGGLARRVLLCATELCSVHFQYGWDPDRVVGNSLFSDGAGAVVLGAGEGDSEWRLAESRSWIFPESEQALTWHIGDHGFRMNLSAQLPGLINRHLRAAIEPWLATHGVALRDVGSWAVHPGGPRILGAVSEALALPSAALQLSRDVLAEHGNMSSPTVLFILDRLRHSGTALPCVALGFGPGLNAEAALFA